MRKRQKEIRTAVLFIMGVPAAMTAPVWVGTRWVGLTLAVVGWALYAYFVLRVRPETHFSCPCPPEADDRVGQVDEG